MGAHGKYHLMVSFEAGEPTSVIVSYVGKGGGILSAKWVGVERLPTLRSVARVPCSLKPHPLCVAPIGRVLEERSPAPR